MRRRGHLRHAVLLVSCRGRRVVIDAGDDWLGRLERLRPEAIVVTHAHPDHVGGLARGAPCPVYATEVAWRAMRHFPIAARDRRVLHPGRRHRIAGLAFDVVPVRHSLLSPAIALRIAAGGIRLLYAPDVLSIPGRAGALHGVHVYLGDGASITRPVVRGRGSRRIGHASIRMQLDWCRHHAVARAIFTHCGTEIVAGDDRVSRQRVRALGSERGVEAEIARDGASWSFERSAMLPGGVQWMRTG